MTELTPADIERMTREMNDRLGSVKSTGNYFRDSATLAAIMAEYPPAIAYNYFLMTQDQLIQGNPVVRKVTRGKR